MSKLDDLKALVREYVDMRKRELECASRCNAIEMRIGELIDDEGGRRHERGFHPYQRFNRVVSVDGELYTIRRDGPRSLDIQPAQGMGV